MARHTSPPARGHPLHRPAVGVPPAAVDARPVHLAAADHAHPLRAAGDGLAEALLQQHRLSQYWVRPFHSLMYCFLLCIFVYSSIKNSQCSKLSLSFTRD